MQPRANTSGGWFWLLGLPHATHMAGVAFGCSNRAYGECQEEPLANLAYSYRSCGGIRREGERDYNNTTDQETDRRICWSFISWASMSSTFWLASQPKSELGECVTWNCQHPMSWFWNVLESTMSSSLVERACMACQCSTSFIQQIWSPTFRKGRENRVKVVKAGMKKQPGCYQKKCVKTRNT